MEFSSVFFLEIFLPASLLVYYLLSRLRSTEVCNVWLLAVSLLYYAWSGFAALGLFICFLGVNYGAGLLIERARLSRRENAGRRAGWIAGAAVSADLLLLIFYKYFPMLKGLAALVSSGNSISEVMQSLLRSDASSLEQFRTLSLPLAVSFLTFQAISYLADVAGGKTPACRRPDRFALYMSFFPQLTQGPIMRYGELGSQIVRREHSAENIRSGLRRFCFGLGKKVLIADILAKTADQIWEIKHYADMGSRIAWFGIFLYTLQIYFDFSAYSDMAVGIGRLFGFRISENFNMPYTSLSVRDFWRRWHMTLSFWFRDYLYIPLGGSRCGTVRGCLNLLLVFAATGIWHGANLTFWVWGLYFALLVIAEKLFLGKWLEKNPVKLLNRLYSFFLVMMGWVLFRADSLQRAGDYFSQLFSMKASPLGYSVLSYLNPELLPALAAGILIGFFPRSLRKFTENHSEKTWFLVTDSLLQLIVLAVSLVFLISGSFKPSIYGRF